jgi:alkylation response protein AidB-like acyl-CoA dehydrogenase
VSGEKITAIAMTEPGIGSDLASMSTTARREGDHYVVNGAKTFLTNGIDSDLVITAVKTAPTQKHKGTSLLVLERGMEGFERYVNEYPIAPAYADARVTRICTTSPAGTSCWSPPRAIWP